MACGSPGLVQTRTSGDNTHCDRPHSDVWSRRQRHGDQEPGTGLSVPGSWPAASGLGPWWQRAGRTVAMPSQDALQSTEDSERLLPLLRGPSITLPGGWCCSPSWPPRFPCLYALLPTLRSRSPRPAPRCCLSLARNSRPSLGGRWRGRRWADAPAFRAALDSAVALPDPPLQLQ